MKTQNLPWAIAIIAATGLGIVGCWLWVGHARPTRIRVEQEQSDITAFFKGASTQSGYDPHFNHVNFTHAIHLPATNLVRPEFRPFD